MPNEPIHRPAPRPEEPSPELVNLIRDAMYKQEAQFGRTMGLTHALELVASDLMVERDAAESRAQEAETKLRDALDAVVVLREVIDDFFNYQGGCEDPRQDDYLMDRAVDALTDTSALAAQRKREIQREALEDAWERVIAATVTLISDGHTQELLQAAILNPEGPDANTEGA